jgi:hypothetical protein
MGHFIVSGSHIVFYDLFSTLICFIRFMSTIKREGQTLIVLVLSLITGCILIFPDLTVPK